MSNNDYLDPAHTIIEKLGGLEAASNASGASESWVSRWRISKDRGGTGGLVPAKYQAPMLAWARKNKKPLTEKDFFPVPRKERKERARVRPKSSVPRDRVAA